VVKRAARVIDVSQASIRILDASRTRLMVGCRAGPAIHENAIFEFKMGEGLVGWVAQENRPLRLGHAHDDPRYMRRNDQVVPLVSFLGAPLSYEGRCIGVLSASSADPDHFTLEHEEHLMLLSGLCSPYLEIARLARVPYMDALTGTLNRAGLDQTLPDEQEQPGALSVAVVDIDGLRHVNERCGRAFGDELLRAVGRTLAGSLRIGDAVARYGGDEFLLVTPNVSVDTAVRIFDRARLTVANATIVIEGQTLHATVSVGVAERIPGERRQELVRRAEEALASVKKRGGNGVRVAIED
jgi:diguanylate cyclase (GGDEF)-like protein